MNARSPASLGRATFSRNCRSGQLHAVLWYYRRAYPVFFGPFGDVEVPILNQQVVVWGCTVQMARLDAFEVLGMRGRQRPSTGEDLGEVATFVCEGVDDNTNDGEKVDRKPRGQIDEWLYAACRTAHDDQRTPEHTDSVGGRTPMLSSTPATGLRTRVPTGETRAGARKCKYLTLALETLLPVRAKLS